MNKLLLDLAGLIRTTMMMSNRNECAHVCPIEYDGKHAKCDTNIAYVDTQERPPESPILIGTSSRKRLVSETRCGPSSFTNKTDR